MSGARVGGKKSSLLDFSILPDGKRRNYENEWRKFCKSEKILAMIFPLCYPKSNKNLGIKNEYDIIYKKMP